MNLYWKLGLIAFALLSVLGALWGYGEHKYQKGYDKAMQEVATAQAEANTKVIKKRKEIKHETQGLNRESVIRELCKFGWARDRENCPK
jgi:hypothetical protein